MTLVVPAVVAQFDPHRRLECSLVGEEYGVVVVVRHADRVRVEVETYNVFRLPIRRVVGHVDGVVVVDLGLHAVRAHHCCTGRDAQVAAVRRARIPG